MRGGFMRYTALLIIATTAPVLLAQLSDAASPGTAVTSVTGTISQLNYGSNGEVQGFLVGTNTLLSFPTAPCGGIGTLGAAGNSVTYSGTEITAKSGFETVTVSSLTNNTTKASYTAPTRTTSSTSAYGPTSGTVKQLNYAPGGGIDGFLFSPAGSSAPVFVSIGGRTNSTLDSLLTVGAALSVTGVTSPAMSACAATDTLETVNATTLVIGSTTIIIAGGPGGYGGQFGGPSAPFAGRP
jgi:hypothetical protein